MRQSNRTPLAFSIILVLIRILPAWAASPPAAVTIPPDPGKEGVRFVRQWGTKGEKPGQFHFPIGIAIDAKDHVYVTDHLNHRVQKFDGEGKRIAIFEVLPNPAAIALDDSGTMYLTHFHASGTSKHKSGDFLSVYSPKGKLLRKWGQTGSGDGEFNCPGGLAINKEGHIYVADQTNHRVQVFDRTGQFLFKWGEYGNRPGEFGGKSSEKSRTGGPQFVALDASGNVWTTEGANCRIQKFSPKGRALQFWGTREDQPGGFGGYFSGFKSFVPKSLVGPIGLCFDKHGQIWISAVSGRVQHFSQQGEYLGGLVNEQGKNPGQFFAPHGVAIDSRGRLYVVDSYNHRIQKFDVGEK